MKQQEFKVESIWWSDEEVFYVELFKDNAFFITTLETEEFEKSRVELNIKDIPENYYMENDSNFVYNVYEIGQKIDRKGRVRTDKLVFPHRDDVKNEDNKDFQIQTGTGHKDLYTEYFYIYSEDPAKITKPGILEPLNIRFMKDVIRLQGSYTILATAAKGVQDAVGDDSDSYIVKLFNGALNTKEYKDAYRKGGITTKGTEKRM